MREPENCYADKYPESCRMITAQLSNDSYCIAEWLLKKLFGHTLEIVRQYFGKSRKVPRNLQKDARLLPFHRFSSLYSIWNICLAFYTYLVIREIRKTFLKFPLPSYPSPKHGILDTPGITECQIWQNDKQAVLSIPCLEFKLTSDGILPMDQIRWWSNSIIGYKNWKSFFPFSLPSCA